LLTLVCSEYASGQGRDQALPTKALSLIFS
jgi:hypothetical protein